MNAAVSSEPFTLRVNDEERTLGGPATLADLLRELGLDERKGVAAAVNDAVVARGEWRACSLAAGDRVLVIRATQGG
jgi:sulfur carrier protein